MSHINAPLSDCTCSESPRQNMRCPRCRAYLCPNCMQQHLNENTYHALPYKSRASARKKYQRS